MITPKGLLKSKAQSAQPGPDKINHSGPWSGQELGQTRDQAFHSNRKFWARRALAHFAFPCAVLARFALPCMALVFLTAASAFMGPVSQISLAQNQALKTAQAAPAPAAPAASPAASPAPAPAVSVKAALHPGDYGDSLVGASIGDANNLIPALSSDTASGAVVEGAYRGLVKYDENLNTVGDLAESWEFSEDQKTVTFKIRPGVLWADGQPFTAADCVFTWKLMSDPNTPTAYGEAFSQIESAEAVDDLTFRVTFKRVMARALITWGFSIMPKHLLEGVNLDESDLARKTVGTGPFQLEKWDTAQTIITAANALDWEGRPNLDRQVTKIIPDPATQMMELATGTIDIMGLEPDQWIQAQDNPLYRENLNFFRYPAFSYTYLGFNQKDPRLSDVRVRKAIAYAIDKNELIEGVLLGFGTPANGPFKPDMWANNKKVSPYPFDPTKAKELLAQAGWVDQDQDGLVEKNGQKFVLTIMLNQGNKVREQTGLVIQSRLKDIGIEVKLRVVEWAAFLKEYIDKHDFEAIIMGWTIPLEPDLYDVFNSSKTKPGELNFISYANPEVDQLIDQARFNLDREIRKQAFDRIQEIFFEEVPYVFLFVPESLTVISKRFMGPQVAPLGLGYNINFWYVPKDRQLYVK
ncbi:MAG: peptide-binding protein [Deltaproteobacteria bacterium]|nr:peptide-binding protein [Deltaproteobacteria bacterium]